jgi:hypothetical protein
MPLHVTMRCLEGVPRLRTGVVSTAIRDAMARAKRFGNAIGFRVIHVSIQANHVHAIVEAKDSAARGRGMASFEIAVAKAINRVCGRRGKVFAYRYHAVEMASPRQVRNTIAYVFGNWRHHGEDRRSAAARRAVFDPYSSASEFDGWSTAFDQSVHVGLPVDTPTVWLLTLGWRRHGAIDPWVMPGPDFGSNRHRRS